MNFASVKDAVDLRQVVEADAGPPGRGGRWRCPIHNGESENFGITPDGRRFRCWSCGAAGDVVDYVAQRDRSTIAEAVRVLDPGGHGMARPARPGPPRPGPQVAAPGAAAVPERPPTWRVPAWQEFVSDVVRQAETELWQPAGREALRWLRARGLKDATIRRFRLGFVPQAISSAPLPALGKDKGGVTLRARAVRGVTLPWVAPGESYAAGEADGPRWVGCNVRRLPEGDLFAPLPKKVEKYRALKGSERGHGYVWPEATMPGLPAVVCEGEFDALTAWQQIGHLANVVTFGGAGQGRPRADAAEFLGRCPEFWLAFDNDGAGDRAAREMSRTHRGRCRRLRLPGGVKDLNDMHRERGSVADWFRGETARFGGMPSAHN